MNPLDFFGRIPNASLSGYALMFAMLLCFLTGMIATRVAYLVDARAFWRLVESQKPDQLAKPDDHDPARP